MVAAAPDRCGKPGCKRWEQGQLHKQACPSRCCSRAQLVTAQHTCERSSVPQRQQTLHWHLDSKAKLMKPCSFVVQCAYRALQHDGQQLSCELACGTCSTVLHERQLPQNVLLLFCSTELSSNFITICQHYTPAVCLYALSKQSGSAHQQFQECSSDMIL